MEVILIRKGQSVADVEGHFFWGATIFILTETIVRQADIWLIGLFNIGNLIPSLRRQ